MSKRGVEPLRTAFFQAAFSAAQHDAELKSYYLGKRKGTGPSCMAEAVASVLQVVALTLGLKSPHAHPHPQTSRCPPLPTTLQTKGTGPPQPCSLKHLPLVIACLHRLDDM